MATVHRAMEHALRQAGLKPGDILHLNAHSTSPPVGDVSELEAIKSVFGGDNKTTVSATKSVIGPLLGAAGGSGRDLHDPCTPRPGRAARTQP